MPNLSITEYRRLGHDVEGSPIPAGLEPSLRIQNVTFSSTMGVSQPFLDGTRFVRIVPDEDVRLRFVPLHDSPTVSLADMIVVAGQTEFFCVSAGQSIAVRSTT